MIWGSSVRQNGSQSRLRTAPRFAARPYGAIVTLVLTASMLMTTTAMAAKLPKPGKWKPTVVIAKESSAEISPDHYSSVVATCPRYYDVIGGSYVIGGGAALSHVAAALPVRGRYEVVAVNPPTSPFVRAQDANVTVAATCALTGTPIVVNGSFPDAQLPTSYDPYPLGGGLPSTVTDYSRNATVNNGEVSKIDSVCKSRSDDVFSGGWIEHGSNWADAASAAVLSKTAAYSATIANPGFNPTLGVPESPAVVTVHALCAKAGQPIVVNEEASPAAMDAKASSKSKPKSKPAPKPLHTTVKLVKATVGGITSGTLNSADAKCPRGYSVFGGSYLIGGNSVLAHATVAAVLSKNNEYAATVVNPPANINTGVPRTTATLTVAANCAKNSTPIIVNGPFG